MEIKKVDRKAVLEGDVDIWFKEKRVFLDRDWEPKPVTHFEASRVAIIESDGHCYATIACVEGTLAGLLYETRDSFDDLVAQYNAGSNASENGGVSPAD